MRRTIIRAIGEHLRVAQTIYRQRGTLTPKLWVYGKESLVAEPITPEGIEATEKDLAELLCSMRSEHGGNVIGRSEEVWVRIGDDLPKLAGRLADHVDSDPSIRTGLLVAGFDHRHDQLGAIVSWPALLDDGSTEWRLEAVPDGHFERVTNLLVRAGATPCDPLIGNRANEIGWHIAWI